MDLAKRSVAFLLGVTMFPVTKDLIVLLYSEEGDPPSVQNTQEKRGNQETSCVDKQDEPHCLGAELFFSRVGHPTCAPKVLYLTRCSNVFGRMQTSTYGFSITKPRKDDFKNCAKTLKFSVMM
jgi:hypothetical protein